MIRLLVPALLCACIPEDKGYSVDTGWVGEPSAGGTGGTSTFSGGETEPGPPEDEEDRLQLRPAATEAWVFLVDTDRDLLTRVSTDATSVTSIEVCDGPESVLTTPDKRTAVVLCPTGATMALVDVDTLATQLVTVRDDLDHMELSPDGRWAMAWFDSFAPGALDGGDGLQSFSEASFVEVATARHVPLVVGYRPREVAFTPDGASAVIVSDTSLAVIDLAAVDLTARLIELDPDTLEPPAAEEIALDPSGSWTWVRRLGGDDLLVVEIASGTVTRIGGCQVPTDLDISPDGATAFVVCRGSAELLLFQAGDPALAPKRIALDPSLSIGQIELSPDGSFGVLYTTAFSVERYTLWTAATDALTTRGLVKPVASLDVTPPGDSLVIFHALAAGDASDPEFNNVEALTLVDLDSLLSVPIALPAAATGHALGVRHSAVVLDGTPLLVDIDHASLLTTTVPLPSAPVFTGLLPDPDPLDDDSPRAWVNQEHDLGRISFFDPDDGSLETITGFSLNGGIEE
jgi:DNA-binding beta-propeller fold protein YncE